MRRRDAALGTGSLRPDRVERREACATRRGPRREAKRAAGTVHRQGQLEVDDRQPRRDTLRPFDQAYRMRLEVFGKARGFPFIRIVETIKIKVIEV